MRPARSSQSTEGRATLTPSQASFCADPPSQGGKFIKASKGGGPTPSTTTTGPSPSTVATSPKMETRKKKKCKITKRTVTSETVSLPEKKRKLISESPNPEAEIRTTLSVYQRTLLTPSSGTLFITSPALLRRIAFDAFIGQYLPTRISPLIVFS